MFGLKKLREMLRKSQLAIVIVALTLISGLLIAGAMFASPDSAWRSALLTVGGAVLSGGVFAWLTKLAQLGGVIREELEAVVYGKSHLGDRTDRVSLWLNATRALYETTFPEIGDLLDEKSLKAVIPTDRGFYLRRARRVITIDTIPGRPGWVSVKQEMLTELVTEKRSGTVDRTSYFYYRPDAFEASRLPKVIESQKSRYFLKKPGLGVQEVAKDEVISDVEVLPDERKVTYRCQLNAGLVYEVNDCWSDEQNITIDNLIGFVAASYVHGLEVLVSYPEKLLIVQFHSVGGAEFEDIRPVANGTQIHKVHEGLLFSDAGFQLSIQSRIPS
jgi:hypothetical protein